MQQSTGTFVPAEYQDLQPPAPRTILSPNRMHLFAHVSLSTRRAILLVLVAAVLVRIPAVIWSKGFMASDDQYETVEISYDWLRDGPFNDDGYLTWHQHPSSEISRFPLYTMMLYGVMRLYHAAGIENLDSIMYGVRALHAALSLLIPLGMFGIVRIVTRSNRWGVVAGLIGALHFGLPYLSVRSLIEMACGECWLLALLALYLFDEKQERRWLLVAGLLSGLAWSFRFQIAAAALPIPFVLWWQHRSIRPAVDYLAGVLLIVVAAALVDWWLIGVPLGSFINHVAQGLREGELYRTSPFLYPLLLIGLAVPPVSVAAVYWMANRKFWSKHIIVISSILSFVFLHTLAANRQERFILPVLPAFLTLVLLAFFWRVQLAKHEGKRIVGLRWLVWPSVVANLLLLALLTTTYSRKGIVEPMVLIERAQKEANVLLVTPEQSRIFPFAYGGFVPIHRQYIASWGDLPVVSQFLTPADSLDFVILYPPEAADLPRYLDSLQRYFGHLERWGRVEPSMLDRLLHSLNPNHNKLNQAEIYRAVKPSVN